MAAEEVRAIVVMGVSGSGKTTVGRALAERLGWPFYDGDDFHPAENVSRMAAGRPLTDVERRPWLERLNRLIGEHSGRGESLVLACSALKRSYRDLLRRGNEGVVFVYLRGEFDVIAGRMRRREGHFMPAGLLASQFETLEEPEDALVVNVDAPVSEVVELIAGAVV